VKKIRPVSDLRNNFAEISKIVHETSQPVFLTKNGYSDMVVLSMDVYENMMLDNEIYLKIKEAETELLRNDKRYSSKEAREMVKTALK